MTTPVVTPPAMPGDTQTEPAGNFTNPAFLMALIPQIAAVVALFHSGLGVKINGETQGLAILGAAVASLGAYIARAVKHHAHGQAVTAWWQYLAEVQNLNASYPPDLGPSVVNTYNSDDEADSGTDNPPPLPPLDDGEVDMAAIPVGMVSKTRATPAKAAVRKRAPRAKVA